MAWTDKYVDLAVVTASKDAYGTTGSVSSVVFTPGTAVAWTATGNPLAGRKITFVTGSAGTYTIATHNATTVLTWTGGDPADTAATGVWYMGTGTTADPFCSLQGAETAIGATATAPMRFYVRGSQSLSANYNMSSDGTTLYPVTWVGSTGTSETWTLIGNDAAAAKPTLTCGALTLDVSGDHLIFECLAFTSSHTTAGGTMDVSGTGVTFKRCRFTATGDNSNSVALRTLGQRTTVVGCFLQATTANAGWCIYSTSANAAFIGNVIVGGKIGIYATGSCGIFRNLIYGQGAGSCIETASSAVVYIDGNTLIGSAASLDGIRQSGSAPIVFITNNLISNSVTGGQIAYPINHSHATETHYPVIAFNAWYNCTNDKINGIIETQATHGGPTLDFGNLIWNTGNTAPFNTDPLPNAASLGAANDFDLAATHKALAFPGAFEVGAQAYIGYLDHGAVQRVEPAAGGVAIVGARRNTLIGR